MTAGTRQPDWYLHDGDAENGPLTEVELRKQLASASKSQLEKMRVRQGASDWHPAARVLARFKELAQNGVYLKLDEITHGPFTPERAAQVLRSDMQFVGRLSETLAKVGRHESWTLAAAFLASLDRLLEQQKRSGGSASEAETPLAKAILIEEPMAPTVVDSNGSRPVAFFEASLIEDEPEDSPNPATTPRPVSQPRAVSFNKPAVSNPQASGGQSSTTPRVVVSPNAAGPLPVAKAVPISGTQTSPANNTATADSSSAAGPPPVPYPRPVIKQPTKPKSDSKGRSPWLIGSLITVCCVLLLAGVTYALVGFGSDESSEDAIAANGGADANAQQAVPLSSDNKPARPPVVTVGMLFRPEFQTTEGPVSAGSAFAARLPGSDRPIIISALHLFGPAGGMDRDVPASSIPAVWKGLSLFDCVTQRELGTFPGRPLLIDDTKPFPESSDVGDVVAYMPNTVDGFKSIRLSEQEPRPGDRVWLVSEVVSGTELVHGATVVDSQAGFLVYRFDDASIELVATSGAPVVNASHDVVAVNAGGGEMNGATHGLGTPTYKFFEPLARAAGLR